MPCIGCRLSQEPIYRVCNKSAPVRARDTPARVKVPFPCKSQRADGSDLTFEDTLDLDVAPLVPAVQPREFEIAIQSTDDDDLGLAKLRRTTLPANKARVWPIR